MRQNPASLLVRITDFLQYKYITLGGLLSLIPTHHIVMENILYGKESDEDGDQWETYDLKPISYFYPERDLMNGNSASQSTIDRLVDKFEDKLRITQDQFEELKALLLADTTLLMESNVVDYSLFLIRFPASSHPNSVSSKSSAWRTGVTSTDQKWTYRAVLLDFFWSKHKLHAKVMTRVVQTFNVIGKKGPMSITTTPEEYRERFLSMVNDLVEVNG